MQLIKYNGHTITNFFIYIELSDLTEFITDLSNKCHTL